jgi:5-methylcytosine-specific restriction endonuclease McrA
MTLRRKKPPYPSREQLAERREWGSDFYFCWVCGQRQSFAPLEVHEIASRAQAPNRWATQENYFRACSQCNSHVLNNLPESLQLAIKKHFDPDRYDRVLINRLRGRADNAISEGDVRAWNDFVRAISK